MPRLLYLSVHEKRADADSWATGSLHCCACATLGCRRIAADPAGSLR